MKKELPRNFEKCQKKRSLRLLEEKRDSTFMIPLIERGTQCDQMGCRFFRQPIFEKFTVLAADSNQSHYP